tara:strand:- start:78 stop:497 length:420 start_codon:yes stop_codon:yes gene_type:complete
LKKALLSILVIVLFFLLVYFIKANVSVPSGIQIKINEISSEYKGVVSDKFAVRNTNPTHLKIITKTDIIEITPYQKIVDLAEIGDSLIKPANQNIAYLKKQNGQMHEIFYTKLSLKTRNHKSFPKEWKEKWMESSAWDK